jgi:hypothetical protein
MYKSSLQFLVKEIVDTNWDRIVGIELQSQHYRWTFKSALLLQLEILMVIIYKYQLDN